MGRCVLTFHRCTGPRHARWRIRSGFGSAAAFSQFCPSNFRIAASGVREIVEPAILVRLETVDSNENAVGLVCYGIIVHIDQCPIDPDEKWCV